MVAQDDSKQRQILASDNSKVVVVVAVFSWFLLMFALLQVIFNVENSKNRVYPRKNSSGIQKNGSQGATKQANVTKMAKLTKKWQFPLIFAYLGIIPGIPRVFDMV